METFKLILIITGYVIVLFSLIPLIREDYWIFRVFEYPRLQKLMVNSLILVAFLGIFGMSSGSDQLFTAGLTLNLAYLCYQVFPFTVVGKKQLLEAKELKKENQIGLYIGNVYQYNRECDNYLNNVRKNDPDVIMLVETDSWWAEKMEPLKKDYPYQILVPLENTYGMMLFSKFELIKGEVKYLVEKDIPSIHTLIKLPSGQNIQFYGLHPEPPVPQENPRSTERDKEILMVAKEAKNSNYPVMVAGDLNDVAWSYTTELFSKTSGLLDPRKGRGFFNTFHAKHLIMRFPLDHIFCSVDFNLVDIQRMPNCGSDHFAMYIKLQYSQTADLEHEEPEADAAEQALADEKIEKV